MKVKLLQYSPISMVIIGARTCYDSFEKSDTIWHFECEPNLYLKNFEEFDNIILNDIWEEIGENDKKLIERLINLGHHSVLEHIVYTFYIQGISRLCLQELVRHRIASYSVQSTRYVLKKILNDIRTIDDIDKYFVYSPNIPYELQREEAWRKIELLKKLKEDFKNDDLKYLLPENLKTELVMTVNCRELRHIFELRLSKKAHWEIRELCKKIYEVLPQQHKELLFFDIEIKEE